MRARPGTWALVAVGIALLWLIIWLWSEGFFDHVDGLLVPGVFLLAALSALARLLSLLRRHRHRQVALLWCRRFSRSSDDPAERRNGRIETLLGRACRGLVLPVTLRDLGVSGARSVTRGLEEPLAGALMVLGMALFMWLGIALSEVLTGRLGIVIIFLLFVCTLMLIAVTSEALIASVATYRGEPAQLRERLRRVIDSGRSRSDFFVVRCTDSDWQASVSAVLEEASLALIDLTEGSGNIDWEIRRCLERLGSDRVLFLDETGLTGETARIERSTLPGSANREVKILRYAQPEQATDREPHAAACRLLRLWVVARIDKTGRAGSTTPLGG